MWIKDPSVVVVTRVGIGVGLCWCSMEVKNSRGRETLVG